MTAVLQSAALSDRYTLRSGPILICGVQAPVRSMLRLRARGRARRGTAFDPLGRTAERRAERAMIAGYETLLVDPPQRHVPANLAAAADLAAVALDVRGCGHVKEQAMVAYPARLDIAMRAFDRSSGEVQTKEMAGAG